MSRRNEIALSNGLNLMEHTMQPKETPDQRLRRLAQEADAHVVDCQVEVTKTYAAYERTLRTVDYNPWDDAPDTPEWLAYVEACNRIKAAREARNKLYVQAEELDKEDVGWN